MFGLSIVANRFKLNSGRRDKIDTKLERFQILPAVRPEEHGRANLAQVLGDGSSGAIYFRIAFI